MSIEFVPFPKIPRLNRSMVVSEKIDGTNAAILIVANADIDHIDRQNGSPLQLFAGDAANLVAQTDTHFVFAQSRNKFITPGKSTDNYGFAGWVQRNAEALVALLGEGRHYGEWWGSGIQSAYGLNGGDKRFSLFNTGRWVAADLPNNFGLGVVPVVYEGPFDNETINDVIDNLRAHGSWAAPGFMRPEGVVVYQVASRTSFKVTLEGDAAPKGAAGHALDLEKVAA